MATTLTIRLNRIARRQFRQDLGVLFLSHLCLAAGGLGVICLANWMHPLPEVLLGWLVSIGLLLWLLSLLGCCLFRLRHRHTAATVAREVEALHPDLRDALNCALELEGRQPVNELEAAVVSEVRRLLSEHGESYVQPVLQGSALGRWLVGGLLALGILLFLLYGTAGGEKFLFWLSDLRQGQSSGLVVLEPAPGASFMVHEDVKVRVKLTRWRETPRLHGCQEGGRPFSFELYPVENKEDEYVGSLYDLTSDLRFRVTTSALSTGWRCHEVYPRPFLNRVRVVTEPQPYTGRRMQTHEAFGDLELVAGERVRMEAGCEAGRGLWLESKEHRLEEFAEAQGGYALQFVPEASDTWAVMTRDLRGKPFELTRFTLSVTPDLPPEIDWREPSEDRKVHLGDSLRIHVKARDDFGLRSLIMQYRVAGRTAQAMDLSAEKEGKSWQWNALWNLPDLKLEEGDVISCLVKARDNRVPKGQVTRSQVVFITVVPDLKQTPQEEGESQENDGQKETKADLSDLIHDSKRLLRMTHDLMALAVPPEEERKNLLLGMGDLQAGIARRAVALAKKAGVEQLPEPYKSLFGMAADQLGQAMAALRVGQMQQSLPSQESALAALVRVENEMLKNTARQKQRKQAADAKQQGDKQPGGKQGEQEKGQKPDAENARLMEQIMAELRTMIQHQEKLNRSMENTMEQAEAERANQQRRLRREAREMEQKLIDLQEAAEARALLDETVGEMTGAEEALLSRQQERARLHGGRAVQRMMDSLAALEKVRREAQLRQVRQLAESMAELARSQAHAEQQSHNLQKQKEQGAEKTQERTQARRHQEQLRQNTLAMERQLAQAAESLADAAPQAAEEVRRIAQQLAEQQVTGHQKKAMNALLYRRYDRAATEQGKAREKLERLSGKLQETAAKMPGFTEQELRRQLERLQKNMENAKQAAQGEGWQGEQAMTEAEQDAERNLKALEEMLKDERLQALRKELSGKGQPGTSLAARGERLMGLLQHAAVMGMERLKALQEDDPAQVLRSRAVPPDRYRRQVEEYFKRLGE